jgi:hypothetical protein
MLRHMGGIWNEESIEVVSKPPLGLNLCVGLRRPILEIFPIWMLVPIFLIGAVGRLSPP